MTLDLTQYSEYIDRVYRDTPTTKEISRTVNWSKEEDYETYNRIFRLYGQPQYGQRWSGISFKLMDSYTYCNGRTPIAEDDNLFNNVAYNEGFYIRNLNIEFIFDPLFSTLSNPNWLDFRMKVIMYPTFIANVLTRAPNEEDYGVQQTEQAYEEAIGQFIPNFGYYNLLAESKPITLKNKLCRTRLFLPDVQFIPRGYDLRIIYSAVQRGFNQDNGDFNYNMTRYVSCEFYGTERDSGRTYLRH